jgi:hypothetical protein
MNCREPLDAALLKQLVPVAEPLRLEARETVGDGLERLTDCIEMVQAFLESNSVAGSLAAHVGSDPVHPRSARPQVRLDLYKLRSPPARRR